MPREHRSARTRSVVLGAAVAAATVAAALVPAGSAGAASASMTLTVNAGQTFRPVTHVASGSLYGLAGNGVPSDSLIQAIKPREFVQMAPGGRQQGSGDALVVAPAAQRVGAKVVVRMIDYYAGWPYRWVSWSDWENVIRQQISQIKASAYYSTVSAYAPFNEADQTWTSSAGSFNDGWVRTYRLIRSLDPNKPIQGPSFSNNIGGMQSFLQNAKATNTMPDSIAWHELAGAHLIQADIQKVNGYQQALGMSPLPIDIEEYASPSEVGIPGALVGYIGKFERFGVRDAELPFWNQSGALGDLLTKQGGSPNGAYWLYKWYAEMSGNMVTTTPYSQTSIDGAAALTSDGRQLSVIFGGGTSGSSAVQLNNLGSALAGSGRVHVKLETTVNTGRTGASSGATTTSQADYTVTNGALNVPVNTTNTNGYRLTVTPVGSSTTTTTSTTTTSRTSTTTTSGTTTTTRTTTTTGGGGGGGCTATATTNQWDGGFVQSVSVVAGSATSGWRVSIGLPGGAAITSGWSATFSGSTGTVTASNVAYNGNAGGGGTSFGFQGTGSASGTTFSCSTS